MGPSVEVVDDDIDDTGVDVDENSVVAAVGYGAGAVRSNASWLSLSSYAAVDDDESGSKRYPFGDSLMVTR